MAQKFESQLRPEDWVVIFVAGGVIALVIALPWVVVLRVSHLIWGAF